MTLVVEDGTGVTGADAYISLADAEALYLDRFGSAWSGTDAEKEAAIRRATSYVDSLNFVGTPANGRDQALAWPREDATDRDGEDIAKTELPREVERATGILAFAELTTPGILTPEIDRTAITKREKVGSIEVEYAGNPGTESWQRTTITAAMDILKPLIVSGKTKFLDRA
jgi:hypothetical protein